MNQIRHCLFDCRMLVVMTIIAVFLTPLKSRGQVTLQPGIEDEETGEEILARETFYHLKRAGGPGKSIPAGAYEAARQQSLIVQKDRDTRMSVTSATSWVNVNPTGLFYNLTGANYISGRTNSFAFHPTDPNTFYIGAAGGGVWKTTDGGSHFQPTTDNQGSLTSGAVAVDPNNPNVIYVATGELNYSLDSYYGNGIFKSTDAGATWTQIVSSYVVGDYFSTIIVNPQNSNIIYAAGSNGVYKSTTGGVRWKTMNSGNYANSLLMDPTNPQILYVATQYFSTAPILRTTDGGDTWNPITFGIPSSHIGRIALAISPSSPNVLYASIANDSSNGLLGIYQSLDSGQTWILQNSSVNYLGSQGWYDNAITVNPADPNSIIVGGLDVYGSTDGGATLTQKSVWYTNSPGNMTHADIHFLGYNGSTLYCGSDGGVYKSTNDGVSWSDMNQTISTLQFQSADYDPTNTQRIYGGTQDNDKEFTTDGGAMWIQRTTGDGGYTVVDPVNPNYVYGQYVNGSLERSNNNGLGFAEISPSGSSGGLFYNPYEMAPGDHNTIVFGRSDVWKTSVAQSASRTSGWTRIATAAIVNGSVSAIGISYATTNKIYIGTNIGGILVTTDGGGSWSSSFGFPYVSDFAVDNNNDSICYATCTGFIGSQHVYKTTNSGANWMNIGSTLPNIPVNTIVLRTAAPRTLFVGTDLGVYKSSDEGATWVAFNSGMPAVEIFDLKYKESTALLLAATHGRGCFTFDLSALSAQRTLTINSSDPPNGVSITISPNDINGYGNDLSPFSRVFYDITGVSLTAPATQGGNYFSKWLKDGSNLSLSQTINLLMDTDHTVSAIYNPLQTEQLILTSLYPASGVSIGINPTDNMSQGNGITPFVRYFYATTPITLTAAEAVGANHFLKWQMDGVDYSESNSTTITLDGYHTMNAVYGPTIVSIAPEWNLVSVSMLVPNLSKTALYPTATSEAFAYNGSYSLVDTLATGLGYWLRFSSPLVDTMSGIPITSDTINVVAGWNLIGSLSAPLAVSLITSNDSGIVTSNFFGYNGGYSISDTLYPGEGYWVKVNQSGTLILSIGSSGSLATIANSSRIRIIPTDEQPPSPPKTDEKPIELPRDFALDQNYPNPFNPTTTLKYALPADSKVKLVVYNVLGQTVATLIDGMQAAGYRSAIWNGNESTSGVYFYKLEATSVSNSAKTFTQVKKMLLIK